MYPATKGPKSTGAGAVNILIRWSFSVLNEGTRATQKPAPSSVPSLLEARLVGHHEEPVQAVAFTDGECTRRTTPSSLCARSFAGASSEITDRGRMHILAYSVIPTKKLQHVSLALRKGIAKTCRPSTSNLGAKGVAFP